jgi:hypothetical protein
MLLSLTEINNHSRITNNNKTKAREFKTKNKSNPAKNNNKINKGNKMKHKQKTTIKRSKKNKMISYLILKNSSQNISKKIQKLKQA